MSHWKVMIISTPFIFIAASVMRMARDAGFSESVGVLAALAVTVIALVLWRLKIQEIKL